MTTNNNKGQTMDASKNMATDVTATFRFVTAGKAYFTIENTATGGRYTFRVRSTDNDRKFFVDVLTGSDNTNSYTWIGSIYRAHNGTAAVTFYHGDRSRVAAAAVSVKAAAFFFKSLSAGRFPAALRVYHANRCCRCARQLTTPESVTRGVGPVCAGLI